MNTTWRKPATSIGLLILRMSIGGYMLTHGIGKLRMLIDGQYDAIGDPLGIGAMPSLILVVFAEFLCALLVMIGLLTRLAAIPIVVTMAVAAFVAHGGDPWTMEAAVKTFMAGESQFPASKQPALIYMFVFLALVFTGAGGISFDAMIRRRKAARAGEV